jgi:hypothetical protein
MAVDSHDHSTGILSGLPGAAPTILSLLVTSVKRNLMASRTPRMERLDEPSESASHIRPQ